MRGGHRTCIEWVLVLTMGALFIFRSLHSAVQKSPTFDEPCFVAAGYSYLRAGDFRMNPEHPPLAQMLMGLPLLAARPTMPLHHPSWASSQQGVFGWQFLFRANDADRLVLLARIPTMALVLLTSALVRAWARRLYGPSAGLWALLLFALEPNVIAHGRLATTDTAAMLGIFGTLFFVEDALRTGRAGRFVLAWLFGSFAFTSKYSTVFVVPCIAAVALVTAWQTPFSRWRVARRSVCLLCGLAVAGYAAIWAVYGFRFRAAREPGVPFFIPWEQIEPKSEFTRRTFAWMRQHRALPEAFIYGTQRALVTAQRRPAFLCGRHSDTGWWHYFLVTFALKTPVPLIVLLGAHVVLMWLRKQLPAAVGLWLPPLLYFLWSLTSRLNIGHRHLLPIYPFVTVMAGGCAAALARRRALLPRVALLAMTAWCGLASASIHPHYLAYFNELCGGPSRGYRLLVDSNLDWGQDLKGLKRFMDERGIPRVNLSYFGTADPTYYGIDYVYLPSFVIYDPVMPTERVKPAGYFAISATNLQGVYFDAELREMTARFRRLEPVGVVGHSIFVYRQP